SPGCCAPPASTWRCRGRPSARISGDSFALSVFHDMKQPLPPFRGGMRMKLLRLFLAATLLATLASAAYGQRSLAQLESTMIGSWVVRVAGDERTRTLTVTSLARTGEGTYDLAASYGFTDEKHSTLRECRLGQSG